MSETEPRSIGAERASPDDQDAPADATTGERGVDAPGADAEVTSADGETEPGNTPGPPIAKDDLFHLLRNRRRRDVIRYLKGREEAVRMRDVAEQVAAWENDTTVERITSDQRQRVYIALYQSHLETLDEAGVINYNQPRGIVEPTPLVDYVAEFTDIGTEDDGGGTEAWTRRYLGVSVAGSVLLSGAAFDLAGFEAVSGFAASVLILAMFSLLTAAMLWFDTAGEE